MRQSRQSGMRGFLAKLARTEGSITIHQGVLTFPDQTTVDLRTFAGAGLNMCWHCGAIMNEAQQYICGCEHCREGMNVIKNITP